MASNTEINLKSFCYRLRENVEMYVQYNLSVGAKYLLYLFIYKQKLFNINEMHAKERKQK